MCHGDRALGWRDQALAARPNLSEKPLTQAFLHQFAPIDGNAPNPRFRESDGKRWYSEETLGNTLIEPDDPLWLFHAKASHGAGFAEEVASDDIPDWFRLA